MPAGMPEAMLAAWRSEVVQVWPDLGEPARLAARLLDAQLLWVWLCTLQLLPKALAENALIGRDATRSPRSLLALAHYWTLLARDAAIGNRAGTVELAESMVTALGKRLGDGPAELPLFPAFRNRALNTPKGPR
jgi:hypothetical protein